MDVEATTQTTHLCVDHRRYNSNRTVRWTPREVVFASTDDEVIRTVRYAVANGLRVVTTSPHLWSWTTSIAVDGAINVQLTSSSVRVVGDLAIADGGTLISAVYDAARHADRQLDAHGGCLQWRTCQTVGGTLATNVHHAGLPAYGSRCEWVEIVDPRGKLVRVARDTPLFRLTVGGSGRTGVIVRAAFRLSPRTYYRKESVLRSLGFRASFEKEMEAFVEAHRAVAPLDLIYGRGLLPFGLAGAARYDRVDAPSDRVDQLDPRMGEAPWIYYLLMRPLWILAQELGFEAFSLLFGILLLTSSQFSKLPSRGDVHLDIASTLDFVIWEPHQEVEFFVPVPIAREFGAWWDEYRRSTRYLRNAYVGLRYVYGDDLAFAANSPGGRDYVCFNIDSYHVPSFRSYTRELQRAADTIRTRFNGEVRTHPGKLNLPSGTYSREDLRAAEAYDPQGTFAVAPYDPSRHSFRRVPSCVFIALLITGGVFALLYLVF